MINFGSIQSVECLWADDGSSYFYRALPESINANAETESLRFTMREVDGQGSDLEIVIQKKADESFIFKTDYYDEPQHEYGMRHFKSDGEYIFHFRGKEGVVYFHITDE